jgi:adenine-specific DNA-methyltransferase
MYWKGEDIGRYWASEATRRFCRPDVKPKSNEVVHLNNSVYETIPKILLRQTADTIIATLDCHRVWFGRSIIAIVKVSGEYSVEYLLGVINSTYLRYQYDRLAHETGRVFAQVKLSKLKQLHIRTIDFSNAAEKALHDRMVMLVERMLELNRKKHPGKLAPSELDRLDREIAATDAQIDDLVYDLYAITPEERKIIEGTTHE